MTTQGRVTPRRGLLGARYELQTVIATGGMGQVWSGRDTLLGRPVAIKVLRGELAGDPSFLPRFRAEAQHAAMLNHPNIAAVHDYGEEGTDDGAEPVAFLVMELVEGEALAAVLARTKRLGVAQTLDIVAQTASALSAAHDAGVIHRDIKPGNVLVRNDGVVKITDFGIAWSAASVALTGTGQVVGTAHYLSPEQAQGVKATPASDVYSLGLVAYECLAGRRPFDGENSVQVALMQIREQPAPLPVDIPEPVRSLVAQAMVKNPAERIPDASSLRNAVDRVRAQLAEQQAHGVPAVAPPAEPHTAALFRTAVLPARAAVVGAAASAHEGTRLRTAATTALLRWRSSRLALAIAVVAVGLVAAIVAAFLNSSVSPSTPAARPSPARVPVDVASLVGHPVGEVQAQLTALGLVPRLASIQTASVPEGTVIAVAPSDALVSGQSVTVTVAVAPPAAKGSQGHGQGGGGDGGD